MRHIYLMFEKFLALFKSKPKSTNEDDSFRISFILQKDSEKINVECDIPNLENSDDINIPLFAEKFANLLTSISVGELNDLIFQQVKNYANNDSNKMSTNYVLFFNNVITFWALLYKEKKKYKHKIYEDHWPIIKPSQVFRA
jgi:hypothetical protein